MLGVLLPAKASVLFLCDNQLCFSGLDLGGEVIACAGIKSKILLIGVSRRRTFAMNATALAFWHHIHSNLFRFCFCLEYSSSFLR